MTTSPITLGAARAHSLPRRSGAPAARAVEPIGWTAIAVVLGVGITELAVVTGWLPAGFRAGPLSAELNAVDGAVALLIAFLSHGRFVRGHKVRDRLIAHGLAVLGLTSLLLPIAMTLLPSSGGGSRLLWGSAALRLIGAGLVAIGALRGNTAARWAAHRAVAVAAPVVLVAVVLGVTAAIGASLPPALVQTPAGGAAPMLLAGHPLFALVQVVSAMCFLVAAIVLTRIAAESPGELAGAMGPAFMLGTFALLQYALFPTLSTDWLSSGDLLRTGCYAVLLIGAALEIRRYWTGQSRAAVLADRRRLAREIHDGVVQEVSFIRMEARSMRWSEGVDRIVDACDRALDEARDAVHALALSHDEPLDHLLERAAHDLSRRHGTEVSLRLVDVPDPDADQRHALVRIVREAIANSARHGMAEHVVVTLLRGEVGWELEVQDDGRGFDPDEVGRVGGGYGLISMRERADALPGRCAVESRPGDGTTVRVTW